MDFPRLQLAALGALALASGFLARRTLAPADRWLAALTSASVLAQLAQFAKYTPVTPKQVMRKRGESESAISLLTSNVRMRNRSVDRLLDLVNRRKPDLVLLLEPDDRWARQLERLHAEYPYRVLEPLENTYGLLLYSRLPLIEPRVRFLVHKDVPSIRTRVRLRNGQECWFYGIHPRPPVRGNLDGDIELPGSAPRDAELVIAAMEIRELGEPVIVAGDFNDVAWSRTTRRFQRLSRTLDPRVGRGLYSTYHAGNRLLRFPLDHLFVSEHFAIAEFIRDGDIGSDHFPLYAQLVMTPEAPAEQEPPAAEREDFHEAKEDIAAAAKQ
jgi:endonuclease/exonuclease/phosphatase (EEP) superfamily protein YafD